MLEFIQNNAAEILAVLLAIHALAVRIALKTDNKVDDEVVGWVGKIANFLAANVTKLTK